MKGERLDDVVEEVADQGRLGPALGIEGVEMGPLGR